jgi:transposase-like protein
VARERSENRIVSETDREIAIERWRDGKAVTELAKELGVHRNTINNWIRGKHRYRVPSQEEGLDPQAQKVEELRLQIEALEGTVGRQAMEIRFFKGAWRRVEELRQARSGNGGTASTPKSGA